MELERVNKIKKSWEILQLRKHQIVTEINFSKNELKVN